MEPTPTARSFASRKTLIVSAILAGLALAALLLAGSQQGLELKYKRVVQEAQLVTDLRVDLFTAAEAEKSAVLAETDQASEDYAAKARAAVERMSANLARLRSMPDSDSTTDKLAEDFDRAFGEYRKVDEEVLRLAVQNTNLKALALSFGEAGAALADMERALGPVQNRPGALRALTEALRIQSLHAPHIMEKTEARMDALEQGMGRADKAARAALASLPAGPEQASALAAYGRYWKTTTEVVRLSRQNTNVRSLTLSLERKTKVLAACNEALRVLEEHLRERMGTKATR
jgi:hypothetical protein